MACHQHRLLGVFAFRWGQTMSHPKSTWHLRCQPISPHLTNIPYAARAWLNLLYSTQEYSFTLTAGDGSRLHGFCRQARPFDLKFQRMQATYLQPKQCVQKLFASATFSSNRSKRQQPEISSSTVYHKSTSLVCILLQDPASHRAAPQAG